MKFKRCLCLLAIFTIIFTLFIPITGYAGIASYKPKFLGSMGENPPSADPNFSSYWNEATYSEFWSNIEPQQDVMNYSVADQWYNSSQQQKLTFLFHSFFYFYYDPVSGFKGVPGWLETLSAADIRFQTEQFISLMAQRYPNMAIIDVINEIYDYPPPASIKAALGGDGASGYDWAIWLFQKTRQYFPNTTLLAADWNFDARHKDLINALKNAGITNFGFGYQGHFYENKAAADMKYVLDDIASTGVISYVTEFDLNIADDNQQKNKYAELFPVIYDHPNVYGVNLWGYKQGEMWQPNAYLVRTDGSERPALQWIRSFMESYDTVVSFSDRPNGDTALTGSYAGINWGSQLWWTTNNGASGYAWINSGSTSQVTQTFTLPAAGKVLKRLVIYGGTVVVSSPGNPDRTFICSPSGTICDTGWTTASANVTVKVTNAGGAWATSFTEIVYGTPKLTVLSASASSTYLGTWTASRAIDGLITPPDSTTWSADSAAQPQWLKLDLGSIKTVNKINIAWYHPTVSIYTYNIQVSTDDITYTTVVPSKQSTLNTTWLANTFVNTSARYIKINITASTYDWDAITEAEVYGY